MSRLPDGFVTPAAVLTHHAAVRRAIVATADPTGDGAVAARDEGLTARLAEHERQSTLTFVASVEGVFRHDLTDPKRPKGTIKRGFTSLRRSARAAGRRGVRWDDLMAFWGAEVGSAGAFGRFAEVMRCRNWLAHGRHYAPRTQFSDLDLEGVASITVRILRAIVGRPDLKTEVYQEVLDELTGAT